MAREHYVIQGSALEVCNGVLQSMESVFSYPSLKWGHKEHGVPAKHFDGNSNVQDWFTTLSGCAEFLWSHVTNNSPVLKPRKAHGASTPTSSPPVPIFPHSSRPAIFASDKHHRFADVGHRRLEGNTRLGRQRKASRVQWLHFLPWRHRNALKPHPEAWHLEGVGCNTNSVSFYAWDFVVSHAHTGPLDPILC